ncbi:MAG: iron-containing alcohol dehydrogenase [Verrucomicrobiota bacterium]
MSESPLSIDSLCAEWEIPKGVREFRDVPGGGVKFGCGALDHLGAECASLGGERALLVTDPGLAATGSVRRAMDSLEGAGLDVVVYDQVRENPNTDDVTRCVATAKKAEIDLIVGLGGGSSLDTAKGCNFILTNGGTMHDYWGVGKAAEPMLPFVAVPTTSGTGSECQSFALIADAQTHAKMACGDKKAAAAVAILDPELTLTMPSKVTSHTGIDAISHALETAVCKTRNETSMAYSDAAWRLLDSAIERVMIDPNDLEARARMLLGSAFAGTAIENSMLGIAHSCANPLTAHYGIVHGQAVGVMLPHVIAFNSARSEAADPYASLGGGKKLADRVKRHLTTAGLDRPLSDQGVDPDSLPQLAGEAAQQWTAQFNPVKATESDLLTIYKQAFEGG